MSLGSVLLLFLSAAMALFSLVFAAVASRERKTRAVILSGVTAAVITGAALVLTLALPLPGWLYWTIDGVAVGLVLLFFGPFGGATALKITEITSRVDERDTMFAREEYQPGTEKYETYYRRNPDKKAVDDKLRALPELLAPGGRYYDEVRAGQVKAVFAAINDMTTRVDGEVSAEPLPADAAAMTAHIKQVTARMGADEVGVAPLNPMHVYSHVGRGPEPWGAPIDNRHRFAIVFTLEMDYFAVEAAPQMAAVEETAAQYLRAASISVALARLIRKLGYPARAHISDSNYQIILPAVAHDAGLGEIGRHGYLISRKFGSRVRLGGVTTDLPLVPDEPVVFGVQDFCAVCKKCAENCPPGAIPHGAKSEVRGVEKWPLTVERCLHYWRVVGTDCGLCMRVCPYSHPATFVHNVVRRGIERSAVARRVSVWGDDLMYGRRASYPRAGGGSQVSG